ncbi:MAG: bifunctional oligoribonuclease/PAP phosphatase NrnA [Chitinophagales bacterium]
MSDIESVKLLLEEPKRIVLTTHTRPDGDAMGSSLALYHYLKQQGHDVSVITPTNYSVFLHFLPGDHEVIIYENHQKRCNKLVEAADLLFVLDYNAPKRAKPMDRAIQKTKATKIMIDHHLEPEEGFAAYAFWSVAASSTCELVYEFISQIGSTESIDKKIATCLYTGICTDTGRFKFSVTPRLFEIVADLLRKGININKIHTQVFDTFSEDRLRFLGFCLTKRMMVFPEYNTAFIYVTERDFRSFNYQEGDKEGLVNYPLSLAGFRFAALITENDEMIKLSFRSKGNFSVNDFARNHFEGGGHKNASGGLSRLSLEATIDKFIDLLPKYEKELTS